MHEFSFFKEVRIRLAKPADILKETGHFAGTIPTAYNSLTETIQVEINDS